MWVLTPTIHWLHRYDGQILLWNKEWNSRTVICIFDMLCTMNIITLWMETELKLEVENIICIQVCQNLA